MLRRFAVCATLVLLVGAPSAVPATGGESFFYGFTEDLPKEIGAPAVAPAADLGAQAFRLTLMWEPGQTQLAAADVTKLDRAVGAAPGMRIVLAVYANAGYKAPADATARDQYCTYVRNALSRYASIADVVVWNEPNKNAFWNPQTGADAAYEALLARCWDVLHGARSDVNVIGLALSSRGNDDAGSTSPGAFIRALGDAYRASDRTKPILDTVAHHTYGVDGTERPWRKHIGSKVIAEGDWNKLMYNLWLAFDGTAQPIPGECGTAGCVSIWYLESGFQTRVDEGHAAAYTGTENDAKVLPDFAGGEIGIPSETSAAPDQLTQVLDAGRLAACQPHVTSYFNFLLFDEPALVGWQSGAYWADRAPKDSLPAFRQVITEINARAVDCDALKGGRPSADFLPPTVPVDVSAAAYAEPLRIEISWSASTDDASAVAYRVYRNGAHVATTSDTRWTNTAVASGATYTYTVRAIDAAGNLGNASTAVTVTTPDTTPPSAPTALAAQVLAGPVRVQLSWAASTDGVGVAAYDVYRDGVLLGSPATPGYVDDAVAPGTTYSYAVVARDAAGNTSSPATVTATTPADATPPTTPTGLAATRYGDRVELRWTASTDDVGVTTYEVLRDGVVLATTGAVSYTDRAVVQGRAYVYSVRSVDAAGNRSASSSSVKVTVPDTLAPTTPTGLRGEALSSRVRVRLTWNASTDNVAVTGYRVFRNGTRVATLSGTTWTDTSVARSTTYRYSVQAVDARDNKSAQSAPATVTTRAS